MGAPLTIEQMIINHNIGVSFTNAEKLEGYTAADFAKAVHSHSASDIKSGIFDPQRLPIATQSSKGIVQLSTSTTSTAQDVAATPAAVNAVRLSIQGKADITHKHWPSEIQTGEFPSMVSARSINGMGTRELHNIIIGNTPPTDAIGQNGDVYLYFE